MAFDNKSIARAAAAQKSQTEVLDHSSHEQFYEYYAQASQNEKTRSRFIAIRDMLLRVLWDHTRQATAFEVADIGCGAGTLSILWAELGHRVHGLDVNEPLLSLAKQRAADSHCDIDFRLGSATALPWPDSSMDVCMVPELLEHVAEWQTCLWEFSRVLRPNGILFLTTSNKLCPVQQEFNLPLYSWYPAPIKRKVERLAITTRPDLANFAKYPAVNWFSFYGLRRYLSRFGFDSMDRFDLIDSSSKGSLAQVILLAIRTIPVLRFLAHVATPGTTVVAIKRSAVTRD
jgi:2-polyprenyl-6-hydroxyphenyl methylase/3-demethylubiquinone-9 3-methyltransferase